MPTLPTPHLAQWFSALALAALGLGCSHTPEPRQQRPNIVFILVDDLGWQDTSVAFAATRTPSHDRYHTPHLERLAREGMKLTRSYAAAPVCTPTRASLMTGKMPLRTAITNWTLHADRPPDGGNAILTPPEWNWAALAPAPGVPHAFTVTETLPQLLREAGYRTIHAGKWHLGGKGSPGADPCVLGFDVNIAGHAAGSPGSYLGQESYRSRRTKDPVWDVPGLAKYHGTDTFLTDAITKEAIREVERAVAEHRPFFLHLAHYAVHVPLERDERFYGRYLREGLDDTEARYAALVEGVDASTGQVLACLERLGVEDDTLLVFTSDNGGLAASSRTPPLHVQNAPLKSGKGSPYEGGIRVPCLVRWPGVVAAGSSCSAPIVTPDFFVTLLHAAGIRNQRALAEADGLDLTGLWRGEVAASPEREIVWHYPHVWGPEGPGLQPFSAILAGSWKLVYFHQDQHFELYDLDHDLGEAHDLAQARPDVLARLRARLHEALERHAAGMPVLRANGQRVPLP